LIGKTLALVKYNGLYNTMQQLLIGELRGECVKKLMESYVMCLNDIVVDEIDD